MSDASDDRPCLARVSVLGVAFTAAAAQVRTHTLSNVLSMSTTAARGVMCDTANHDLSLSVHELIRFRQLFLAWTGPFIYQGMK